MASDINEGDSLALFLRDLFRHEAALHIILENPELDAGFAGGLLMIYIGIEPPTAEPVHGSLQRHPATDPDQIEAPVVEASRERTGCEHLDAASGADTQYGAQGDVPELLHIRDRDWQARNDGLGFRRLGQGLRGSDITALPVRVGCP
jgi:hypothetical protein